MGYHYHINSEEIYYILQGKDTMRIEFKVREISKGDGIAILPKQRHKIWNTEVDALVIPCRCSPANTHGDTVLTD